MAPAAAPMRMMITLAALLPTLTTGLAMRQSPTPSSPDWGAALKTISAVFDAFATAQAGQAPAANANASGPAAAAAEQAPPSSANSSAAVAAEENNVTVVLKVPNASSPAGSMVVENASSRAASPASAMDSAARAAAARAAAAGIPSLPSSHRTGRSPAIDIQAIRKVLEAQKAIASAQAAIRGLTDRHRREAAAAQAAAAQAAAEGAAEHEAAANLAENATYSHQSGEEAARRASKLEASADASQVPMVDGGRVAIASAQEAFRNWRQHQREALAEAEKQIKEQEETAQHEQAENPAVQENATREAERQARPRDEEAEAQLSPELSKEDIIKKLMGKVLGGAEETKSHEADPYELKKGNIIKKILAKGLANAAEGDKHEEAEEGSAPKPDTSASEFKPDIFKDLMTKIMGGVVQTGKSEATADTAVTPAPAIETRPPEAASEPPTGDFQKLAPLKDLTENILGAMKAGGTQETQTAEAAPTVTPLAPARGITAGSDEEAVAEKKDTILDVKDILAKVLGAMQSGEQQKEARSTEAEPVVPPPTSSNGAPAGSDAGPVAEKKDTDMDVKDLLAKALRAIQGGAQQKAGEAADQKAGEAADQKAAGAARSESQPAEANEVDSTFQANTSNWLAQHDELIKKDMRLQVVILGVLQRTLGWIVENEQRKDEEKQKAAAERGAEQEAIHALKQQIISLTGKIEEWGANVQKRFDEIETKTLAKAAQRIARDPPPPKPQFSEELNVVLDLLKHSADEEAKYLRAQADSKAMVAKLVDALAAQAESPEANQTATVPQ